MEDGLRSLHVSAERSWSLGRSLERLSLEGCAQGPGGQVAPDEPPVGGRPWGCGFAFSPTGEGSWSGGMQDAWRLAPRWLYVLWG